MRLATIIFVSMCALAHAQDAKPFTVDMSTQIMGPEGKPFLECAESEIVDDRPTGKCLRVTPRTLGRISYGLLNAPDKSLNVADQAKQGALALKLLTADAPVELGIADRKRILDLLAKAGEPMVLVTRVHDLLAPGETK
jgi:hypothetical protein